MKKLTFVLSLMFGVQGLFACSCIQQTIASEFSTIPYIFVGTVKSVEIIIPSVKGLFGTYQITTTTVVVNNGLKGFKAGDIIRIYGFEYIGPNAACGGDKHFGIGEQWIIFGEYGSADIVFRKAPESAQIFSAYAACSHTSNLADDEGKKVLKELQDLIKRK